MGCPSGLVGNLVIWFKEIASDFDGVVGLRRTPQNRVVAGSIPACVKFLKTLKSVATGPGFDPRGWHGVRSSSLWLSESGGR